MNLNDNPKGGTFCLGKADLGLGNSESAKIDINTAIDYAINGVLYSKSATNDIALNVENEDGTDVSTQADETTCLYLVQINSSGTVSTLKGTEVDSDEADIARCPYPSEDNCPIGYLKVINDGTTFTAATDDLNQSNTTTTYVDLFTVPPEPISL